jgi:hypothetical protein
MQRYLAFVNVPSRSDVTGLGETLRSIEDRLAKIEETLQIAADAVDARERTQITHEPARTRQAPSFPDMPESIPAFNSGNSSSIPEELRR